MPRIVLHIGAAKTATTYIQHALFDNLDVLREHGVYLPKAGRFDFNPKTVAHHHLAWEFLDPGRFRPDVGGWDSLAAEINGVDAETILISSESLERLTYSADRRQWLEVQLAKLSDDVSVVYVVRDQLSHLNSLYTQNVKSFRTTEGFKPYIRRAINTGNFNLDRAFRSWYKSNQLELVALRFEDLVSEDPLVSLLKVARIDVPAEELTLSSSSANESLGPVGLEAAKLLGGYLRGLDPNFTHKDDVGQKIYRLAAAQARANGWYVEKFWGWDPDFANRVAERFKQPNQRFAKGVWGSDEALTLPVDKPQKTANLMELAPKDMAVVQEYIQSMARRYLELRTGRPYPVAPVPEPTS